MNTLKPFRKSPAKPDREWWHVYILRCADGSFYTGIAKDIDRRAATHNRGKGAAYTRSRRPVVVIHREKIRSRVAALLREIEIKRLPRSKKAALAAGEPARPRRKKPSHITNPWDVIFKRTSPNRPRKKPSSD